MKTIEKIKIMLEAHSSTSIVAYRTFLKEMLEECEKYRWHDLRKDPKDLPTTWEDGRFYECVHENHIHDGYYPSYQYDEELGFGILINQYNASTLGFMDCEFCTIEEMGCEIVIAWKEIEPFEENEV